MRRAKFAFSGIILGILLLLPAIVSAQSAISGTVRDTSGAVMPGVTVEATSPALIERSRTATTDGQGRYTIVDLRPGEYVVTASAMGFKTFRQEKIDLPGDATVSVLVAMEVGQSGETVTVQAESLNVDVENATHQQVLTRELQDAIPAPRNMQALAALVPGVRLRSGSGANPDVGGSQQMEQTYITAHGSYAVNTTVLLDGMNINSNYLDGTIQNYVDNSIIQQSTYQTSGVGAEVSAGGVLVNQIPKDGGNQFHGAAFFGYTGSGSFFQANNLTDALKARGATSPNAIVHIEDFNGSVGGPILTNKLWFLGSYRYQSTFDTAPNIFNTDGTPIVEDQHIAQGVARITYQFTSKDKFSGTFDRIQKFKGHELTGLGVVIPAPEAVGRRGPTNYNVGQAKWTRIQTPRMLIEAGFSTDYIYFSTIYGDPSEQKLPFTPEWYAGASHLNTLATSTTRTNAPPVQTYNLPQRNNITGAVSYVTGSHNIRVGIQDAWGKNDRVSSLNADLIQNYSLVGGVLTGTSVTVYNTPVAIRMHVAADMGLYATDTWKYKRMAITGGLRWEYDKGIIDASTVAAGRFFAARSFSQIDCTTVKGLGCWKTFSPRIGVVYDLFGNGKTAIRGSFGQYNRPQATEYLNAFNPMALSTDARSWTDTNGDGIAQDSEIKPSTNVNFGKVGNIPTLDPNYKREYNRQFSAGVTHQVNGRMTVSGTWFRRTNHNTPYLQNKAVDPTADWVPITIQNPYDSANPITAYTMSSAAVAARPAQLYQTNADESKVQNNYTGYEFGTNVRLPRNGSLFGGWTLERLSDMRCDMTIGANNLGIGGAIVGNNITNASVNDPNSLRFCDERGLIPLRSDFRLAGFMPIHYGFDFSFAWSSSPNVERYTNWDINKTTKYPTDCAACPSGLVVDPAKGPSLVQTTLRIPLLVPGSRFQDRLNQLDLGLKRNFKFGENIKMQLQADLFNVLNASTVLVQNQTLSATAAPFGPSGPGGAPTQILQARLLRLALQFRF